MKILEYMKDIADNVALSGRKYNERISIDDGGNNSYISICVDTATFQRKRPVTQSVRLFRHTNSTDKLTNTWGFELGDVCNVYADYPNIALKFESYGKTSNEAESEATKYFPKLRKMIEKQTSDYRIADAESAQEEREKLLARLSELDQATPVFPATGE